MKSVEMTKLVFKIVGVVGLAGVSALAGILVSPAAAPKAVPAPEAAPASRLAPSPAPASVPEPRSSPGLPDPGLVVRVDPTRARKPIADLVYGNNFHENDRHSTKLAFPLTRWGGNPTTRHNWKLNTSNRSHDWFFMNIPDAFHDLDGKQYGLADWFLLGHRAGKVLPAREVLFTIPTIGWTPKARERAWGFSVKKYGAQQQTEQWNTDAGNGLKPDGTPITGNDASDTSIRIGPEWVAEWVLHMRDTLGGKTAANGGVRYFALDNEPDLWASTHRDIRTGDKQLKDPKLGYDELWERTLAYAGAIKKTDPAAQITGPVVWGWCNYFTATRDVDDGDGDCTNGPDRKAHGGEPLLKWYLQKVCAHEKATGVRLVDYLDVHFYPEGLDLRSEEPAVARERLQRVRSLYDPEFKDGSWIGEPVKLLPRLNAWIAEACPSVKTAISEYRFSYEPDGLTSALAQAEALAVFGREGVGLATTWGEITAGSKIEDAFRLYLDYDAKGASALGGTSVEATTSDHVRLPAYAIEKGDKLLVYLFSKSAQTSLDAKLVLPDGAKSVRYYRLAKDVRLAEVPGPALAAGATDLALKLPPWSATLAVVER